jgi:hypothetical protein
MTDSAYGAFLESKAIRAPLRGLDRIPPLASHLFPFQRAAVEFGLRAGSWGLFFDTGLGKTACELEWCKHAAAESNGQALILTPLAVARQIETEGKRWGYNVRVIREQAEAGPGINICNYDRLDKLDPQSFGAIALDESSILKAFTGRTSRALIEAFAGHRWRMAATATPAPNDHMELGQHAEFCRVMSGVEMLSRFFINDTGTASQEWRLKGHAVMSFWNWMASWTRMAEHPRDMGDAIEGFDLPPIEIHRHQAGGEVTVPGELFAGLAVSATDMHMVKRQTADRRAEIVARLVDADREEPWIVWCDTDYEADALMRAMQANGAAVQEVRGSHPLERKESVLDGFASGAIRVIVTKPAICGHGLNWQHAARMAFVGRTFSYESYYQAVRRSWRFGQKRPVEVHLIVAAGEESIGRVIDRKAGDHSKMKHEMAGAMRRAMAISSATKTAYRPEHEGRLPAWLSAV